MPTKYRQRRFKPDRFPTDKATLLDKNVKISFWDEYKLRCWANAAPA